jgi:leucine-rich repeat/coiled-coil domain-containing protein 1
VTCRENLNISKDRDAKATKLINDLSTILREQKAQNAHLKEKVQNISGQCDENSKLLSNEITLKAEAEKRLLLLSEENLAMKSKLSAQDSLLNGLREERNLWSKELATQGASLASDRGRMESQIEFLSTQVLELQGFQKNCKTTLKIKDKVIEDQVLTIKELKQEVNQLKSELSVSQSEWADKLKILQQKLDDELLENQNVTQQVEMMKGQETYYQIQLQDYCDNERKFKDKYRYVTKMGLISDEIFVLMIIYMLNSVISFWS